MSHSPELLHRLADTVGTPYWLYDAAVLRRRIADIKHITGTPGVQARFAMKACPATRVLKEMAAAGIWIDAVSGNEVLRALRAGHADGNNPPVICYTADVFRDNALDVIMEHNVLPNVGSPGMVAALCHAGYRGPVSMRINPGFGHGHVNSCDTGGPSSKHGIWIDDADRVRETAERCGLRVVMLHSHIGSGPQFDELVDNLTRLADEFSRIVPHFHHLEAVNLGGGIPHDYRNPDAVVPVDRLRDLFAEARKRLCWSIGRDLRLEIEPGRYYVAPASTLVTTVTDVKHTVTNEKGSGETFAMVDAGFVDLVRPAMYGSHHRIEVVGRMHEEYREPIVVAGPLCESGDVFTRDETELLQPRPLPRPRIGELLTLHDAGAYGYAMSSNYNSIGRAPQLWLEEDGSVEIISRRESIDDILRAETCERLD
jgi:diaminopimelate decarboxylase